MIQLFVIPLKMKIIITVKLSKKKYWLKKEQKNPKDL
jgi:hypothetical protein